MTYDCVECSFDAVPLRSKQQVSRSSMLTRRMKCPDCQEETTHVGHDGSHVPLEM